MAAVAPGAGAPPPPRPPGDGIGRPTPAIDIPDLPEDQNPICAACGRGKHISDQFSTGRWKKHCRTCRAAGVKSTPKATGSIVSVRLSSFSRLSNFCSVVALSSMCHPLLSLLSQRLQRLPFLRSVPVYLHNFYSLHDLLLLRSFLEARIHKTRSYRQRLALR